MARITKLISRLFWLEVDFAYIALMQIIGVLRPLDSSKYRFMNSKEQRSVILIPGVYETWQIMHPIATVLAAQGYRVHVLPELGYNRDEIDAATKSVKEYIEKSNLTECVIVAHSKGGLIGKSLLANSPQRGKIRGLISLNTPYSGSPYAVFFPLRSVKVFAPSSDIMKSLHKQSSVNRHIVSIYSKFDPQIPGGSHLEGAQNIQVPVNGHFLILRDTNVHDIIMNRLGQMFSAKQSKQLKK
jgi:pimeloyl-ACP methyl ester carboxylesterase